MHLKSTHVLWKKILLNCNAAILYHGVSIPMKKMFLRVTKERNQVSEHISLNKAAYLSPILRKRIEHLTS